MTLGAGAQSAALRYYFFAERQAAKIDDLPKGTPLRDVSSVGIIGAGTMGGGIAMNFLNAGIPVTILEMKPDALERGDDLAFLDGQLFGIAKSGEIGVRAEGHRGKARLLPAALPVEAHDLAPPERNCRSHDPDVACSR